MIVIKLMNKASGDITLEPFSKVRDVKAKINEKYGLQARSIKLVFQGKVIVDDDMAVDSWHSKKVMVLTKTDSVEIEEMNKQGDQMRSLRKVDSVNDAAVQLSKINAENHNSNQRFFEVFNQHGESVRLPAEEHEGLIQGMLLHNQGKAEMATCKSGSSNHQECFTRALAYLKRAETSYRLCRDELLMGSDNFAILCLDMAWCMLKTQDTQDLARLAQLIGSARRGFTNAHGADLGRLFALKGRQCAERVLYVRLQLLEGVLKVLQGDANEATKLLLFAQHNCIDLIVDPQLIPLVEEQFVGYDLVRPLTRTAVTRALRATHNDLAETIDFLINRDLQEKQLVEQERLEDLRRGRQRRYGKTVGGQLVSLGLVDELVAAGFEERRVVSACIESNNELEAVLFALNPASRICLPDYLVVSQLCQMGFQESAVRAALRRADCRDDIDAALELLRESVVDCAPPDTGGGPSLVPPPPQSSQAPDGLGSGPVRTGRHRRGPPPENEDEEETRRQRGLEDILASHTDDIEAHLDLDLEDERQAIELYLQIVSAQMDTHMHTHMDK